jgi:thioredoxin-dependent peroxiredoxin
MFMALKFGQIAPHFAAKDIFGKDINLSDYAGYKIMVSFYRFSSCPFCNLRIQRILAQYHLFEEKGLRMISFWQSTRDSILEHVGKQNLPFPIISDPERHIYRMYHVEQSWLGALKVMKSPNLIAKALEHGFNPATADGDLNQLPADFLINPDQTIHQAFYGEHIGDHISFADIESFLAGE